MDRRESRQVRVGKVAIGGGAPVTVQTMTKTDTRDVAATVDEIRRLAMAGADIVRLAVVDAEAAVALGAIKREVGDFPLVADIHFDYRLALEALRQGVDKIRINPGNIGAEWKVREVVAACRERGVPIRIGVNSGSIERPLLEKYGRSPRAMVESALRHVEILERMDFQDIVISLKASDVPTMVAAYEEIAREVPYPLHLGVTEAGPGLAAAVKSAVGIGHLLAEGIGDTIRVSITGDAAEEVAVGLEILYALGLREKRLEIVSCPTCGRCEVDLFRIVHEVEQRMPPVERPLRVAIMGCGVNGPGEAREADIGLASGNGVGLIFRKGQVLRKVPEREMVDVLLEEIARLGRAGEASEPVGAGS